MNFRNSAKGFIVRNNKLLILKRSSDEVHKANIWEIPGGRLELGEDPFEGLKREVKEETNVDIEVLHPIKVRHFVREDGKTITMLIFLCKALNENVKISEEHSDFDWVEIENCKEKLPRFFHEDVDIFNKLDLKKLF